MPRDEKISLMTLLEGVKTLKSDFHELEDSDAVTERTWNRVFVESERTINTSRRLLTP